MSTKTEVASKSSLWERFREPLETLSNVPRVMGLIWKTHPWLTILVLATTLVSSLAPAAGAWIAKQIVDTVVLGISDPARGLAPVMPWLLLGLGVAVANNLLNSAAQLAEDLLRDLLSHRVYEMIIAKVITLDLSYFENPAFYDMVERADNETGWRTWQILSLVIGLVRSLVTGLSLLVLLLRFNPGVVILLLVTSLPALIVQVRFGRINYWMMRRRSSDRRMLDYLETLMLSDESAKEIKLFNLSQVLFDRYRKLFAKFYRENRSLAVRRNLAAAGLSGLASLGYYAAYAYVTGLAITQQISLGDLTLYAAVFVHIQESLRTLLGGLSGLYEQGLFMNNLYELLALQPLIPVSADGHGEHRGIGQGFVFENVSFRYPGTEEYVLKNINLRIRRGEKIALVGENGAGKTTLIKLLTRLYDPSEGRIILDGKDLRDISSDWLQKYIGVIFQDFVHYHLPARDNIGFGQADRLHDQERIERAADMSGAHRLIRDLPQGYDTVLGRHFQEGHQLSIGEWQKVALGRAFMREAQVLILDEPTASLDVRSEYEIFRKFSELAAGKTAVLISHRFSTVRMADRIVVLEGGRIVEEGSHPELMAKGGLYATLFNMQAEGYR